MRREEMIKFIMDRVMKNERLPRGLKLDVSELFARWLERTSLCDVCQEYENSVQRPTVRALLVRAFAEWIKETTDPCELCEAYRAVGGIWSTSDLIENSFNKRLRDDQKLKILFHKNRQAVESALRERLDGMSDGELRKVYCQVLAEEF